MKGVYTIENLVNGKLYIGISVNIESRWYEHIWNLNKNSHENSKLQRAWDKHGQDNFLFEVLEECEEQFLFSQEHYWCLMLNVHNDKYGYNIRPTNPYGKSRHSEESKKKMSDIQKVLCNLPERIEENRKRMMGKQYGKGHIITDEHRILINIGQSNKIIKYETRVKWRIAATGRLHTKETRKKISESRMGIPCPEKARLSIIERNKGNTYGAGRIKSEEEKKKMQEFYKKRREEGQISSLKGKSRPIEVINKMKETKSKKSYKGINKGSVRVSSQKKVNAYNIDGSIYMKFSSLKDALLHFGKNPNSTTQINKGLKENKLIYNKYWKYENSDN